MTLAAAVLGGLALGLLAGIVLGWLRLRRADRAAERDEPLV